MTSHQHPPFLANTACLAAVLLALPCAMAGLVGHWEFDSPSDIGRATVSGDLQTVGDAAWAATGRIGGALALDGSGDYLRTDASHSLPGGLPTGDTSYTIAAFIQTAADGRNTITFWGNGTTAQANGLRTTSVNELAIPDNRTGGLISYGWGGANDHGLGAGGTPPGTIYDGQWHHVATTYDAATSTKRLYLDGVEIGTGKVVPNLNVAAANFGIGARTGNEPFSGLVDDVRIYDEVLSQSQIHALANPIVGPDTTPPDLFSLSPVSGAGGAAGDGDLVANFDEAIQAGAIGSITIWRTNPDQLVETFDVASSPRLTFGAASVTIDPSNDLLGGVEYYVLIDAGAIQDNSGNAFAGIDSSTTWSFTAAPPLVLTIMQDGGNLVLEWPSKSGMLYNLISNTGLSEAPPTWSAYHDGSTTHANIPSSGTGTNTLVVPMPDDPVRFFAVTEYSSEIDTATLAAWSAPYRGWHYQANHVIPATPGIPGYEDINFTDVPMVFQIPGDPKYYLTFVGFDNTGYESFIAESTDLLNWTNPRLGLGFGAEGAFDYGGVVLGGYLLESYDIKAPRTLKLKDGKFWSLYGAYDQKGFEAGTGSNGLASSDDGLNWSRVLEDPVLSPFDPDRGAWENRVIYQPWLLEYEGEYYNFYNAKGGPEQTGIALSTDLLNWTRYESNPVIPVGASSFNTVFSSDPKVYWDRDHWVCFFFGLGSGGAHIMAAFSRDLLDWTVDPNPLYLAGGNPSGLDSTYAHKISLIWNPANETYYMFYCAVGNQGRGIGLITSKPLDGE